MIYYAHSSSKGYPAQTYDDHIQRMFEKAWVDSTILSDYQRKATLLAVLFHDMGKLDTANQMVLGQDTTDTKLPINHVDAGVAWCLNHYRQTKETVFVYAAYLIHAHHRGLKNIIDLFKKQHDLKTFEEKVIFTGGFRDTTTQDHTDQTLDSLYAIQYHLLKDCIDKTLALTWDRSIVPSYDLRMALSVLIDADHSDTARHYGCPYVKPPQLDPASRLKYLDTYVENVKVKAKEEGITPKVITSRSKLFDICSTTPIDHSFYVCSAPTGKGKTLSLMKLALRIAQKNNSERIFFVIPYTNIIDQSVAVYRDSVVELETPGSFNPGELAESVVNAIHSRVEFSKPLLRKYSQQWDSPINVTTAVQFFDSLFSNHPSQVRKIHHYANSVIVLDEYHTALPGELWKVTLEAMEYISKKYNIQFVFGSGTEAAYWDAFESNIDVHSVITPELAQEFDDYEEKRIKFHANVEVNSDKEFYKFFNAKALRNGNLKHHTIIVANTIANAVHIYSHFKNNKKWAVYHLSTCLCPADRDRILKEIKSKLVGKRKKRILVVATSVMECGIDISFRLGFRERGSMSSTVQLGGRVNRNRENRQCKVYEWSFSEEWLRNNESFTRNPRLANELTARQDLEVNAENCNHIIDETVDREAANRFCRNELENRFEDQGRFYKCIPDRTVCVVIDRKIAKKIRMGEFVPPQVINKYSVSVYRHKIERGDEPGPWADSVVSLGDTDMYEWVGRYNKKIGIYAEFL